MKLLVALALSGLTIMGAVPGSDASEPDRYLVAFKVSHNGAAMGAPRLIVAGGEPARVEIGQPGGTKLNMRFTVSPEVNDTAKLASDIEVVESQGQISRASPTLVVRLGETGGIAFGEKSPDRSPTAIKFTISRADSPVQE